MSEHQQDRRRLIGEVVVVTGGGQGIGKAIALACAEEGAKVGVLDVNLENAQKVADTIEAAGGAAVAIGADIRSQDDVERGYETVASELGPMTGLVNDAAIRDTVPLAELSLDHWRDVVDVNLTGPFICIKSAVPYFEVAQGGSIVSITSVGGTLGTRNRIAYAASKQGLIGLTRGLVLELGDRGIRINVLALGTIESPLTESYFTDPAIVNALKTEYPIHRWGQPDDVTGFATLLLSKSASFCTGSVVYVDGGWTSARSFRK